MANNHRNQYLHPNSASARRTEPRPLQCLFLISLICCNLLLASRFFFGFSSYINFYAAPEVETDTVLNLNSYSHGPCSSLQSNAICCDRTDSHSDICFVRGDVRTHSSSSSIFLHLPGACNNDSVALQEESISPYTRKWDAAIKSRIPEIHLRTTSGADASLPCQVRHDVPALVFFAGGYTGNVFHDFNDGIVPLYITSHHLRRRVALVVLQYRDWWSSKYKEILAQLSDYPPVDFSNDTRTHCFPGAIVGLRYQGMLSIDASRSSENSSIRDLLHMLRDAYKPKTEVGGNPPTPNSPKLVVVSRSGTRTMENEAEVVKVGEQIGFQVEVLRPAETMPLRRMYNTLSSCDVMMGVHGAALTHFLFMRPGALFIQIVPLGVEKLARICFGEPAVAMGLRYVEYKVLPTESSLYYKYGEGDPVVKDPESFLKGRGWEVTKNVYLEGQNVSLNVDRLHEVLLRAFNYAVSERGKR
ncbi:unnamed protein product [Musa acuminata subsp. burmannicoides]